PAARALPGPNPARKILDDFAARLRSGMGVAKPLSPLDKAPIMAERQLVEKQMQEHAGGVTRAAQLSQRIDTALGKLRASSGIIGEEGTVAVKGGQKIIGDDGLADTPKKSEAELRAA